MSPENACELILENIREVVWTADLDLKCTYLSPSLQVFRSCGLSGAPATGKLDELLSPAEIAAARSVILNNLAGLVSGPVVVRLPLSLLSGRKLMVETEFNYLRDERGVPTGFVGVARDVSETAATEQALIETRTLFANIVESIAEVIIVWNLDNTPAFISPGIKTLLGYSPEEFASAHQDVFALTAIMTTESLNRVEKDIVERLEIWKKDQDTLHSLPPIEAELICRDGSMVWTETETGLIRNNAGQPTGMISVTRDISRRKRDEQSLRNQENLLKTISRNIRDVIVLWDLDLHPEFVSASVEQAFGYTPAEFLSRIPDSESLLGIMTPASADIVRANLKSSRDRLLKGPTLAGGDSPIELQIFLKDSGDAWFEVQSSFLRDEYDLPYGIISVARNIEDRKLAERARQQVEEKYRSLIENLNDVSIFIDSDGRFRYISPVAEHMFGYPVSELVGQPFKSFVHPDDLPAIMLQIDDIIMGLAKPNLEFRVRHAGGSYLQIKLSARVIYTEEGDFDGFNGIMSDITEQKLAEEALKTSEEKYRNLIENINEVTYALDTHGQVTFISPVVEHMLGYKATEIESHFFTDFAHPDDIERLTNYLDQMLSGVETALEFRVITNDDYILHVRASSKLIRDNDARVVGISGILSDITKQFKAEKALQKAMEEVKLLSVTDVLTGGFNRGYLNENMPRELARSKRYCQPMAIIMCDLDHFKQINDSYGHQVGDRVLQKFVRDVKQLIRYNIDWVVRYGGEEFLISLPKTDLKGALTLAERLRREVSAKAIRLDDGRSLMITASFGVVCYDPELVAGEVSQDRLINQADIFLYEAKKLGRNRVNGDYFR